MFFFFNDTATTEIYTLSLHDALPIWLPPPTATSGRPARPGTDRGPPSPAGRAQPAARPAERAVAAPVRGRSEEHTSELQSRQYLVCRLLLEKKKNTITYLS